jgi:hypothetical protein
MDSASKIAAPVIGLNEQAMHLGTVRSVLIVLNPLVEVLRARFRFRHNLF